MPENAAADGRACYRCDTPLVDGEWAHLSTTHQTAPHRYENVEKRICVDCLAGIGLLAFARDRRDRSPDSGRRSHRSLISPLHERR